MENDKTELLRRYKDTGDVELRNNIVLSYMDIVKFAALSLRGAYSKYGDTNDIINEGVIALMYAVDSFDYNKNVKFETYANMKVKGALIDYIRKQDFIPRRIRRFGKDLDETYSTLYAELGRTPTNAEIAEKMGLTREQLARRMTDIASAVTISFEELLYEDNFDYGSTDTQTASSDRKMYENERRKILAEAIDSLKPREKQVITLYYYEKLKFAEIAKVLSVTESRICQIHTKSIMNLKHKLKKYMLG